MKKVLPAVALSLCSALTLNAGVPKVESVSVAKYRDAKEAALSFTFDDGNAEHYSLVAPQLEKHGMRGTFWIIGSSVNNWGVSASQIREMSDRGHEMSNHTWTHRNLPDLAPEEMKAEIERTDSLLEAITGKRPVSIAFPFNSFNESVLAEASKGRVGCRTSQTSLGQSYSHSTSETMSVWLSDVLSNGEWGITMTHGITEGWDYWYEPEQLWQFFSEAAALRDRLWVATFSEVAAYVAERDACTVETRQKGAKLIIRPRCSLDSSIYKEKLTLVVKAGGKTHLLDIDPFGGRVTVNLRKLK